MASDNEHGLEISLMIFFLLFSFETFDINQKKDKQNKQT